MKQLIVTSDDFGASVFVNQAVELAHRAGTLTAASLMVSGEGAADAVERARTMPGLGVGLHLVLVDGQPALSPASIPNLVGPGGRFRNDMALLGLEIFCRPKVRKQLRAEITAQFERFAQTGLPLDHVNLHKHFHLHPTISAQVIEIGAKFGMRALRVPIEPHQIIAQIEPHQNSFVDRVVAFSANALRRRVRHTGYHAPDQVFGLVWSGAMTADRLRALLARLPEGITELYLHPATQNTFTGSAPGYRYTEELAALLDHGVKDAMNTPDIELLNFAGLRN
jgi:hopanoid biosynthesis associated protein HpnK